MAAQHARTVQLRRREFGDEINQQLALTIALHMGNDGSPAKLAILTLAEYAPCHYNTADRRTKEMAARGLIKIQKSGKLFLYSIAGDFEDGFTGPIEPPAVDYGDEIELINGRLDRLERQVENLVTMVSELHTIVTSSSHELHTNFTPTSHDVHTMFTPPVYRNVNKEEKKRRREEGGIPPSPLPPEMKNLTEMVNALVTVTGMSGHRFWHELSGEAAELLKVGYTPEQIVDHYGRGNPNGHWSWYEHDWRGRRSDFPKPKEIWETISGAVKWVGTPPKEPDFPEIRVVGGLY